MSDRDVERLRMSADEFRALPETTQRTELIEGEVVMAPAPRHTHQRAVLLIARYLQDNAPDGEVVIAPSDVYLDGANALQPDVFWVRAGSTACTLGDDDYWYGAPDLVVEVLSPATEAQDRQRKFHIYERHGVRELWLVQTTQPFVEVFTLADGTFTRLGLFQPGATFDSPALGKPVDVQKLLED